MVDKGFFRGLFFCNSSRPMFFRVDPHEKCVIRSSSLVRRTYIVIKACLCVHRQGLVLLVVLMPD